MKRSVILVSMIAALGLTACAEEAETRDAAVEPGVLGNEAGGGVIFEDDETSGGVFEEEAEAGGGVFEGENETGGGTLER
jgi:hypothetical protein